MKFYVKIYRIEKEVLVAACDEALCGRVFEEGNLILDVKEDFYKGELLGEEEVSSILEEATIINLVGENIISYTIRRGIVESQNVITIGGIPHAQVVTM